MNEGQGITLKYRPVNSSGRAGVGITMTSVRNGFDAGERLRGDVRAQTQLRPK